MLFTHLYFRQEEKQKAGLHLQQADNKLLNLFFFFMRCSYKISCFREFAYNSSVLVLIFWSASEALAPWS